MARGGRTLALEREFRRDPEVDETYGVRAAVDEDVSRDDVLVDDVKLVNLPSASATATAERQRAGQRHRAAALPPAIWSATDRPNDSSASATLPLPYDSTA